MTVITAHTISDATIPQLTAFYNEHSGKEPIKKFSTRKRAESKVLEVLASLPPVLPKTITNDRTHQVFTFLTQKEMTVKELMAKFDTAYKCITGDLFELRKAGVQLTKRRTASGDYAFSVAA